MSAGKTFTIFAERVDPEPGFDGLVAVMNNASVASGKLISIESMRVMCPSPINPDLTNLTGNQGILSLDRVTGYSGGTEVSSYKFDTASASLPSGVKFMLFPDSVTSPSTVRRIGDAISTHNITTGIPFQATMRAPGIMDISESGRNSESHNILHKAGVSDIEPITLREGEGLACIQRDFGVPQASHFSLTVRVASTGNTYRYKVSNCGSTYTYDDPKWVIFNSSGSGVVIEVWIVSHSDLGEQNIPRLRITRIGGLDQVETAEEITPIKHDTAADLTDIKAYKGEFKAKALAGTQGVPVNYNDYQGVPITIALQQTFDTFRHFLMTDPKMSLTHSPLMVFENGYERWPGDRRGVFSISDELILHPGEGLAIMDGGNGNIGTSEQSYFNIEIIGRLFSDVVATGISVPVVGNTGLVKVA